MDFIPQMQAMPSTADMDGLLQLLLSPFLTHEPGHPLSKAVVYITIVTIDNPVSMNTRILCH